MLYTALKPSVRNRSNSERSAEGFVTGETAESARCELATRAVTPEATNEFAINSPVIKKQVSTALILETPYAAQTKVYATLAD